MNRISIELVIHDAEGKTIKVDCWSLADQLMTQGFTLFGMTIPEIRKAINYAIVRGYYNQQEVK